MVLIGIDAGTTHVKVGAYDAEGKVLAHRYEPMPTMQEASVTYYDPDGLWQVVTGLLRQVTAELADEVVALAVSSMGEAGVWLDREGKVLQPIIPWYDRRADQQLQQLRDALGDTAWYHITGLHPNAIHSVNKWCWVRKHVPEVWQRAHVWLPLGSWLAYQLTGELATDGSLAARTMAFDVEQGRWSEDVLDAAELDGAFLPEVRASSTPLGNLTQASSDATGLSSTTVVVVGGHDHLCAGLASGILSSDVVLDSSGTSEGLLVGELGTASPERAAGFGSGPHVLPGYRYLMGGMYSSGSSLAWLKDVLEMPDFQSLQVAATRAPVDDAPLFMAQFYGAAPPINDERASGAFLDVQPRHTSAHLARAVYEGIVFELRAGIEALEQAVHTSITSIKLVGSAVNNPFWLDMRSKIMRRPIATPQHHDMVTLGAAVLAGLGAGVWTRPEDALEAISPHTFTEPQATPKDTAEIDVYEARYERYVTARAALQDWRKSLT
ncbi:MAG: FGGY family carbohydrate kinase [Deinococcota bacterium]